LRASVSSDRSAQRCSRFGERIVAGRGRRSARRRSAHGLPHGLGAPMEMSLTPIAVPPPCGPCRPCRSCGFPGRGRPGDRTGRRPGRSRGVIGGAGCGRLRSSVAAARRDLGPTGASDPPAPDRHSLDPAWYSPVESSCLYNSAQEFNLTTYSTMGYDPATNQDRNSARRPSCCRGPLGWRWRPLSARRR
jgi:hypothetical protein